MWLGPSYEAAYTASEQLAETVRTVRGGDDLEVMRSRLWLWLLRCWAATTDPADPAHTRQHVTAAADDAHDRLGRMADLDGIARAAQQIDDTTQRAALLDAALSD